MAPCHALIGLLLAYASRRLESVPAVGQLYGRQRRASGDALEQVRHNERRTGSTPSPKLSPAIGP